MIQGKKIAVVGLGQEGISAINYLSATNTLFAFDDKKNSEITKELHKLLSEKKVKAYFDNNAKYEKVDLILRSPGVRPDHPTIKRLQNPQNVVTSATNIFFSQFPGQVISVTGTKGKGTTSTLIYQMLKKTNSDVFLAGNIGTPMLDILPKLKKSSRVVLELSSFQLLDLKKSPHIAVILMVTSEHLDWHLNQDEYKDAKKSITKYQQTTDYAVINYDFPNSKNFANTTNAQVLFFSTQVKTNGVYIEGDEIISQLKGTETVCLVADVLLPGKHNLQNVCASIAVAKIMGVGNNQIKKVLSTFSGLVHRLQLVRTLNGVKYYNDSFATTPETTIAALEAFSSPKILILGGSSKNSDFTALVNKIKADEKVKAVILIGLEGKKLEILLKKADSRHQILTGAATMKDIVFQAAHISKPGDIVLMSPACASFDMFKNYKDRGEQFMKEVRSLRPRSQ